MPLILPGNVATATAATTYDVANSCRFNKPDSAYLVRTLGTPTDVDKWSYSVWVKRANLGANNYLIVAGSNGTNWTEINFNASDDLRWADYQGSYDGQLITDRKFRDVGAWYHLLFAYDADNGVAGNRMRIYVNGVEETSFSTDDTPVSGKDMMLNSAVSHTIGSNVAEGGTVDFDGYMAEVCFIDGQQLTPTSFGEFDEDSPTIWKPIDVSGLTFGNNGFYLDFEDSSALGNDVSGNNLDFTATNMAATDQMTDSPTNNFPTSNPLMHGAANITSTTHSQGNLIVTANSNAWRSAVATFGASAGKWYMECKFTTLGNAMPGVIANKTIVEWGATGCDHPGKCDLSVAYYSLTGIKIVEDTNSSYGDSFTTSDIIGTALDLDNHLVYFAKNNTWQNSGDPTSGATGTGAITLPTYTGTWFFMQGTGGNPTSAVCAINYGNPAFALSSAESDANGYGSFEYAPPSGYLALCTKNLGSDGG